MHYVVLVFYTTNKSPPPPYKKITNIFFIIKKGLIMLPEIAQMNGNICDFEKQFGVTFERRSATLAVSGELKSIVLQAIEWTKPEAETNKRIIGLVAGIDPSSSKCGIGAIFIVNSGSTITGFEIWDINSNVLDSGDISDDPIRYGGGPVGAEGIVDTTYHDVTVTKNQVNNTIRVQGTQDISVLWGLVDFDVCTFDITIDLNTMQPV
jgi:hypothetical protein